MIHFTLIHPQTDLERHRLECQDSHHAESTTTAAGEGAQDERGGAGRGRGAKLPTGGEEPDAGAGPQHSTDHPRDQPFVSELDIVAICSTHFILCDYVKWLKVGDHTLSLVLRLLLVQLT